MFKMFELMRLHKPIGIFLLLWPTLWALWLASGGSPDYHLVIVFILGVVITRSAGCVINDFADRHFDGKVARTLNRPLATGEIAPSFALGLFFVLCGLALMLVLYCNVLTIVLACAGCLIMIFYPFLKRVTHLPQLGLGVAFAWPIPMVFAAVTNHLTYLVWLLFAVGVVWPVIYDTMYAMVDREDDKKIGVKSTAILFGKQDRLILAMLQGIFLILLAITGFVFDLKEPFYAALFVVFLLFLYQQYLLQDKKTFFKAFQNNNWVGLVIFLGILLNYL